MTRIAVAILAVTIGGSARGAYMTGTLTYDDGRTATLKVRRFVRGGSPNLPTVGANFRCSGDACLSPTGGIGFEPPFRGGYGIGFDDSCADCFPHWCSLLATQKRPGTCRIASRIVCEVENPHLDPIIQVVATGMLDVHRTTPRCRAALRRGGAP